jgi:hypothetical protein
MNERLIQQIRSSMEAKSTEELLKIWEENNREEYSDEAFEAIKQLLTERGITLPPQKPFQKRLAKSGIEQMNRPKKVSLALKLLYLSLGIGFLQIIINIGYSLQLAESSPIAQRISPIIFVLLVNVGALGILWFLIYMIGKGRNWARIVYIANYTTEVMIYLIILPPLLAINIIFGIFYITQTILQVIAMVLLFQKPSSEWFRHKRADTLKSLGKEKVEKVEVKQAGVVPCEIGILFDIDELGGGFYGLKAYKIFFSNLDHKQLANCTIFDGDTSETLAGHARIYCICVHSDNPAKIDYIKKVFSQSTDKGLLPLNRRFIEGNVTDRHPLARAGEIDSSGNLIVRKGGLLWVVAENMGLPKIEY